MTKIIKKVTLNAPASTSTPSTPSASSGQTTSTSSGQTGTDSTKGTQTNPYTQIEMAQIQEADTWEGGYVEGIGYMPPMMMNEFESDSCGSGNNPYPQITKEFNHLVLSYGLVEGVGIQATFVFHCVFSIKGYIMKVSVDILPPHVIKGREYYANVEVKKGNNTPTSYKLSRHGEYITLPGHYVIGDCSFELPKSGNITVTLYVGYIYDTGGGFSPCSGHARLLPISE